MRMNPQGRKRMCGNNFAEGYIPSGPLLYKLTAEFVLKMYFSHLFCCFIF